MSVLSSYPVLFRTTFSLLEGCLSPSDAVSAAEKMELACAGIADINNFYGLPAFTAECRKRSIKPVYAVEIRVRGADPFLLICLNRRGFTRANELISHIQQDLFHERHHNTPPREPFNPLEHLLSRGWEGLVLASESPKLLLRLAERSRNGLYALLVRGKPFASFAAQMKQAGIPPLAVSQVVMRSPERDLEFFRLLRAVGEIKPLRKIEDSPEEYQIPAGTGEMEAFFSALPESLNNGRRIMESVEDFWGRSGSILPPFDGLSDGQSFLKLRDLCQRGVRRRYGGPTPEVQARLDYELDIIRRKGFSGYFLIVKDIVSVCPRTCGRGSSASSIVSYLLEITHVDPLAHNLFFERFLNEGRIDPPDIDVDFPWDEREKALSYVFKKYRGRVGMVADHVTFGPRSCIREAAKAYGFEEVRITELVKSWRTGMEELPPYLTAAARRLRSVPRYIGSHPGGVVISPGSIYEHTHLQPSPTGFPVIAWEKDGTEQSGLVKIDLLGNRSLGVLRDSIEMVNNLTLPVMGENPDDIDQDRTAELGGVALPIHWSDFSPLEDRETRQTIEEGDTLGIFYVESPATRQLLKKMGRGDYFHLIIASSIIRPAANAAINDFVHRLRGGDYERLHPLVEKTLQDTRGIMVYQEDVARIAIDACGFSPAEADSLRKILSKKDNHTRLEDYRNRFFAGGFRQGLSERDVQAIWEGVLSFQGYSFCKAHSASYALLSYRLAWMKTYFPLPFFISVINNGGGFYSRQVYINAVRRMGFQIRGVDVNYSRLVYTLEDQTMRIGLGQLKSVPFNLISLIVEERERGGLYQDYFDFLNRVQPSYGDLRILIRSGAVDSLAGKWTRPQLFWLAWHRPKESELFPQTAVPEGIGDYSPSIKLQDQVETMGLITDRHPLEVFLPRVGPLIKSGAFPELIDSRKILTRIDRRITIAGTIVAEKEVATKNHKAMSFVSFEDSWGVFETVFFPKAFAECYHALLDGSAFLITGTVELEFDTPQINADSLIRLDRSRQSGKNV